MSKRKKKVISPPPMPPKSEAELAASQGLIRHMEQAIVVLRQRNVDNAVFLAQQAARGIGPPLVHFCELGRHYGHLLESPPKPSLRVIEGGNAPEVTPEAG
jgi:hypothetical protein